MLEKFFRKFGKIFESFDENLFNLRIHLENIRKFSEISRKSNSLF